MQTTSTKHTVNTKSSAIRDGLSRCYGSCSAKRYADIASEQIAVLPTGWKNNKFHRDLKMATVTTWKRQAYTTHIQMSAISVNSANHTPKSVPADTVFSGQGSGREFSLVACLALGTWVQQSDNTCDKIDSRGPHNGIDDMPRAINSLWYQFCAAKSRPCRYLCNLNFCLWYASGFRARQPAAHHL